MYTIVLGWKLAIESGVLDRIGETEQLLRERFWFGAKLVPGRVCPAATSGTALVSRLPVPRCWAPVAGELVLKTTAAPAAVSVAERRGKS